MTVRVKQAAFTLRTDHVDPGRGRPSVEREGLRCAGGDGAVVEERDAAAEHVVHRHHYPLRRVHPQREPRRARGRVRVHQRTYRALVAS